MSHTHIATTPTHPICHSLGGGGGSEGIGNKVSRQWVSRKNSSHDISTSSAHSIRSTRSITN